jgi:hypothetical protein
MDTFTRTSKTSSSRELENLIAETSQILPEDYTVQLLDAFLQFKESGVAAGILNKDSDMLDLQYIFGTAVDLGLAEWVTPETFGLEESSEQGPSTVHSTGERAFNAELKWVVDLQSPSQLRTLPAKLAHSGHYEWLGPEGTGSPKYLWDSDLSQTVLATPERLQQGYIAVSYTWGRFKERYGPVNGTPWNVPVIKSSVFGQMLNQMKDIMAVIPVCRYFWVDVLCINQDDENQKKEEIAKQASIFGNAKACLGYLWSLDSEDELAHIMASFGDQLLWSLILTSSDFRMQSQLNGLEKLPAHIQKKLDGKLRLDPWFTSLWALQEMVLAPAQIWMTRSGSFCTVNRSIVTTRFFAQALEIMNWAFGFRQQMWDSAIVGGCPVLSPVDAAIAASQILERHLTEQNEAQKSWEHSVTAEQRNAAEMRVKDINILNVMMGQDQDVRNVPESLQKRQTDEIIGSKALKRWLDWGFGEACLNIAVQASRSAIIVAGANRHTSKPRAEAMLAALKIAQLPQEYNPNENLTPGALPQWLQQTLVAFESSMYFYVSHSWRSMSETRAQSSPLFVKHDSFLAYDNIHNESAPAIPALASGFLTSMLPSMGTRSFPLTDFTLTHYSAYATSGWHLHREGVMHLPYGAAIQDIRNKDTGDMTLTTNGPEHEVSTNLPSAVRVIQELDYVKESFGQSCRVIFLPLLYIGDPTAGLPPGRSHTLTSTGDNPVVRGIVLVSRGSSKRHHSMTFWSKAALYSATLVRVKPLEWQDGILVGSALEESAVTRDKELCDFNLCNKPYLWGPKVRRRLIDVD